MIDSLVRPRDHATTISFRDFFLGRKNGFAASAEYFMAAGDKHLHGPVT